MIQLSKIHLQLGHKFLLEDADLTIFPGQHWGVIGSNGSGKSTLFKLLLGQLKEDQGKCQIPKDWTIAHMGQEVGAGSSKALDYVLDGDQALRALEQEIATCEDGEKLANLYAKMEHIQGYSAAARAQQLLRGLGFNAGDEERPVKEFSGGWRIRLNLAQALMCPSDCLLLDEPTNHLDLDATIWLENWLSQYKGTLLIVSHDRDFLDSVVGHIVNFENKKLISYTGNYSAFEVQKADRLAQQTIAFKKQQERVAEIENFVRRFRAKATKAKQAQSRLKELERMERIAPAHIDSPFHFHFFTPEKSPQSLLALDGVSIGYTTNSSTVTLASKIDLNILNSTRVGLLGHNGAGKTTLMKSLAGSLSIIAGERSENTHLKIGYFAQHQLEALDLNASCALHIQRLSPSVSEQEIRNFLGGFGFHGDRAFETITHFSGGEKARLALALIVWQKPNLLLLDEPTNHLDLEMRHALTVALQEFEGAIIIVSHDRHLLKNTVESFILVHDGCAEPFEGTLDDYQSWLITENSKQANSDTQNSNTPLTSESKPDKKEKRQHAATIRDKLKPLTNAVKKLEQDIERLQTGLNETQEQLADGALYEGGSEKLTDLLKQQAQIRSQLEEKEEAWMEKSEALESLKSELHD